MVNSRLSCCITILVFWRQLLCYFAALLLCRFAASRCCFAALLLCCGAALLLCCFAATLLLCCFAAVLRCCFVALLRCCYFAALLLCCLLHLGVMVEWYLDVCWHDGNNGFQHARPLQGSADKLKVDFGSKCQTRGVFYIMIIMSMGKWRR